MWIYGFMCASETFVYYTAKYIINL